MAGYILFVCPVAASGTDAPRRVPAPAQRHADAWPRTPCLAAKRSRRDATSPPSKKRNTNHGRCRKSKEEREDGQAHAVPPHWSLSVGHGELPDEQPCHQDPRGR